MPLTVEYQEKTSAAGKIPGSYFQREGRLDRGRNPDLAPHRSSVAPAVPQGLALRHPGHREGDLVSISENASDVLAMIGASTRAAPVGHPWAGPYAGVRVGRIDGKFVVNPTFAERESRDIDIMVAARATPSSWSRAAPARSAKTSSSTR